MIHVDNNNPVAINMYCHSAVDLSISGKPRWALGVSPLDDCVKLISPGDTATDVTPVRRGSQISARKLLAAAKSTRTAVRRDRYTDSSQLVCVCTQDRGIVLSLYILFSCFFVQPILVHHNGVNGIYCMTLCMFVTWSVGDINGIM